MNLLSIVIAGVVLVNLCSCAPSTRVKQVDPGATISTKRVTKGKFIGLKRKVAVIDFENKTAYGKARLGSSCSDILTTELGKSGRVILIEREKLGKILEEQNLQKSGGAALDPLVATGKILGLNAIVTGSISQFGVKKEGADYLIFEQKKQIAEATVDLRVVDVSNGRIIWTDTGKGKAIKKVSTVLGLGGRAGYDETLAGEALRAAIVKFVNNIIEQIDRTEWSCYVAEVDGGKIYLDAGKESGLKSGTNLKVVHPGKTIVSPATGLVIGYTENDVGTIQVTGNFGDNGSIAKSISGNIPSKGDICKLAK
jgi:curli biogenesis system outer membrane secretion channel CsgG